MFRYRQFVALLAVTHSAMVAAQVGSDWSSSPAVGLGPLLLSSQSPPNVLRLTPTPMQPVTVERGQLAIGLLQSWDN
jgi:hypothetical protein